MKNGIILIDKPQDFTSHDVIAKVRGMLKMRKIGHSGTLDPMATGVLPLFLGTATKACDRMPNHNKAYRATIKLGVITDTQDITGEILEKRPVSVTQQQFVDTLNSFLGESMQTPPMYSAVQVNGQRLYDLARQGVEVERQEREITIYSIDFLSQNQTENEYTFEIECSKGTYIRTICHDIGDKLGCGGTLSALRRINSSGFREDDCVTLQELQNLADFDRVDEIIIPVDTVFSDYEKVVLDDILAKHYLNGVPLWIRQLDVKPNNQWLRLYGTDGSFLGVAKANKEKNQISDQQKFI